MVKAYKLLSAPINFELTDFMWNNLQSAIQFFVPEKIEDGSQKTTDVYLCPSTEQSFL